MNGPNGLELPLPSNRKRALYVRLLDGDLPSLGNSHLAFNLPKGTDIEVHDDAMAETPPVAAHGSSAIGTFRILAATLISCFPPCASSEQLTDKARPADAKRHPHRILVPVRR